MSINTAPRYCCEKLEIKRLALYRPMCVCVYVIKCGLVAHGDVDFASGWRLHCHSSAYARGKEYIFYLHLTFFGHCSLGNLDHT